MKIPLLLSGNFGEIRSDHFHSGIDIKTRGTTGHHIFSIEEGYVSRIKVQANGYGKSIYLTHSNGFTSVYGHLDRYRDDIAEYVKKIQYKRRAHQVDIYLEKETFAVQKGEFIAYSGNTGGSSGPHLHFEVRHARNQHPTNVLKYNFPVKDEVDPRFLSLHLYPIGKASSVNGRKAKQVFPLVRDQGSYTVPWGTRIECSGEIAVGVEVFDYLNGSSNRCGVYGLEMAVNGKQVYSHRMDEFSFGQTRYINAHIDYEERMNTGNKIHMLRRLPADRLNIYGKLANEGNVEMGFDSEYRIEIEATDVAGNSSGLWFKIKSSEPGTEAAREAIPERNLVKHSSPSVIEEDGIRIEIPAGALYQDLELNYENLGPGPGLHSDVYRVHDRGTPLHKPYVIELTPNQLDDGLNNKLIVVELTGDGSFAAGGDYANGTVHAQLRNFGTFTLSVDTLAPEIIPSKSTASGALTGQSKLEFTIRDELSGIGKYEGYIDNNWALFEYDPKNEKLIYSFDDARLKKGSRHELELYITDQKGNVNLYHTSFNW